MLDARSGHPHQQIAVCADALQGEEGLRHVRHFRTHGQVMYHEETTQDTETTDTTGGIQKRRLRRLGSF